MSLNPAIYSNFQVQITELLSFVCFIVLLIVGLLILGKSKKRNSFIYFGWLALSLSIWTLANFLADLTGTESSAMLWSKLTFLGPAFAPTLFLLFAYSFLKKQGNLKKKTIALLFLPSIVIVALIPYGLNIKSIEFIENRGYITSVGPLYTWYIVYLIIFAAAGLRKLLSLYKTTNSGIIKIQLRLIFAGTVLVTLFSLLFNLILPSLGDKNTYYLGVVGVTAFTLLVSYAILRYRFMNIRVILRKSAVQAIVVAIQLIVYGYLIIFANNVLVDTYHWTPAIANFISVFVIALTFVPVRKRLLILVNSIFFSKTPSTKSIIQEVREKISGSVELDKLFASLTAEIDKVVAVKGIKYFIVNKRARVFDQVGSDRTMPPEASLPQWFKDSQNIIVRDEIPYLVQELPIVNQPLLERCQKELEEAHSEIAIPFGSKNNLLGFALLSEKANEESYTKEEIDLLQAVGREATYALDGAILYKEALERIGVTT